MKRVILLLCLAAAAIACGKKDEPTPTPTDQSKDPVVTAQPPKVVSTVPEAGAVDAPAEGEIKITYDKEISLASKTTISINGVYYDDAVYVTGKDLCIPYALSAGSPVNVKVAKPSVKDKDGTFAEDFTLSFKIMEADEPSDEPSGDDSADASGEPSEEVGPEDFASVIIDFPDVTIGNWNAYQYLEPENFADVVAGISMSIYYCNALSGAQMALDTNVDGWPGIEDNDGNSFHINNISVGNSHFTVLLDETMAATLRESGLIIGGQFYTASYLTLFYQDDPGVDIQDEDPGESVDPSLIEFEEIVLSEDEVTPEWGERFLLLNDGSYFARCVVGSEIRLQYVQGDPGGVMGLFKGDWTAIVDGNGTSYAGIELEGNSGTVVLPVDQTVLTALKAGGMIVGGTGYNLKKVTATVKKQ